MNLFQRFTPSKAKPVTEREYTMAERQTTAITLADHILRDTTSWGINDPDQCMAIATNLLALKWLVRTGRLNVWGRS